MEENNEKSEEAGATENNNSVNPQITDLSTQPLSDPASSTPSHRRQEKIGLVTSDKMQKTVVVRVERQVRHRKYKRYIRRRTKFMAHDEIGAHIGDIVRIVETRPLSARKRWRVVEIVQKSR